MTTLEKLEVIDCPYERRVYTCTIETDDEELMSMVSYKTGQFLGGRFHPKNELPKIKNVIFNDPDTIVQWADGTKTAVKTQKWIDQYKDYRGEMKEIELKDFYNPEVGLAMCIAKKALGNKGNFNEVFKKWIPNY